MPRRLLLLASALVLLLGAARVPAPSPSPSAAPTSDPRAEALFEKAKARWLARTDPPFIRYGALIRYLHHGHVFDNWWDVWYRSSDGRLAVHRIVNVAEDLRRLRGIPFSIFGLKIFDTNPDAEPIRLEEPRIAPIDSFGVVTRFGSQPLALPDSDPSAPLQTIGTVQANAQDYQIASAGTQIIDGTTTAHLTFVPLRNPRTNRLRDLWIDPADDRTVQLTVAGLFNGEPYDEVPWLVRYVVLDHHTYVQQIIAQQPLRFGVDTIIPKMEFDFVDFHFPATVPTFTFDQPFQPFRSFQPPQPPPSQPFHP
ncbi:MAG: hypothetical protein ACREM2_11055 [Vulcanimicrobiaceae bacterium]